VVFTLQWFSLTNTEFSPLLFSWAWESIQQRSDLICPDLDILTSLGGDSSRHVG